MRKILLLCVLLSGCGISNPFLVAKYDTNEYEIINFIRTSAELSYSSCNHVAISHQNFENLYNSTLEFKNFTQYLRRNKDTHLMAADLHEIVYESLNIYNTNSVVSTFFCETSLEQIIDVSETIQKVVGDKPR